MFAKILQINHSGMKDREGEQGSRRHQALERARKYFGAYRTAESLASSFFRQAVTRAVPDTAK